MNMRTAKKSPEVIVPIVTWSADMEFRGNIWQKNREEQEAVPYEFIQEVNKMSKDEIVKRFIQEEDEY